MSEPAGWYVDPGSTRHLRYWDGVRWTDFVVEAPPPAPPVTSSSGKFLGGLVAALVLVLVVSVIVLAGGADNEPVASSPSTEVETQSDTQTEADTEAEPVKEKDTKPAKTGMPAVTGLSVTRARGKINGADLGRVRVIRRVSMERPGTVLRQSSRAGKKLTVGSAVTLFISAPWPRVPGVRGMYSGAAVNRLRQAGFNVVTSQRTTTSGRDGVVLSQWPLGLKTVRPHSTIRVVVANLQKPPPPPPQPTNNCTAGYSPCLAPAPDYDCAGGSGDGPKYASGPIYINGSDPYDLDADGDGVACES